ncbi:hypothetical protein OG992_18630 [Micromonospora sp. NBC_00362]|uniref:hypothetical protein n=1 Tax=Micromonospora sp. NBC_00362 TaxID=2975975 RepID=UPI002254994F|nr:hypothetical protein [Micromonospora sp. NBC_00362]MCX5119205.1 hypothetical protein [Micromonospora sp. NBC_00362]
MTFRAWQTLMVALVFAILAAGSAMVYANAVARESERQWCGIVTTMDDAYAQTPPQTPAGRQIAGDIARLRGEFGCPRR